MIAAKAGIAGDDVVREVRHRFRAWRVAMRRRGESDSDSEGEGAPAAAAAAAPAAVGGQGGGAAAAGDEVMEEGPNVFEEDDGNFLNFGGA